MMSENPLISLAAGFYKLLLYLYPASFRQEFGREMVLIFRDESRYQQAQGGTAALLVLWLTFLFDLVATATVERVQEVSKMSISDFTRLAGVGAVLAGIYWIVLLFAEIAGIVRVDTLWFLLAAVGAGIVTFTCIGILIQGGHTSSGNLGLAILALGSLFLLASMLFYAFQIDYDESRAFTAQFMGHSLTGLGTAMIGFSWRSSGIFTKKGWRTVLIVLGLGLMLFWPVFFFIDAFIVIHDKYLDIVYYTDIILLALIWMILGALAYFGNQESREQAALK